MEFGQPAAFVGERVGERVIDSPDPSDGREPAGLRAASVHFLAGMLDVVDYGLLLVSADHRVSFANRAARLDLDECHPLRLSDRSLTARHRQDSGPLRDALDSALCKGLQRLLTLGRNSGHAVSITVLPIEDAGFGAPAQAVVGDGQACGLRRTERRGLCPPARFDAGGAAGSETAVRGPPGCRDRHDAGCRPDHRADADIQRARQDRVTVDRRAGSCRRQAAAAGQPFVGRLRAEARTAGARAAPQAGRWPGRILPVAWRELRPTPRQRGSPCPSHRVRNDGRPLSVKCP